PTWSARPEKRYADSALLPPGGTTPPSPPVKPWLHEDLRQRWLLEFGPASRRRRTVRGRGPDGHRPGLDRGGLRQRCVDPAGLVGFADQEHQARHRGVPVVRPSAGHARDDRDDDGPPDRGPGA